MSNQIDRATFDSLLQNVGQDFIGELLDTFFSEAPQLISQMKSAHASSDAETFRRVAHSLKSNANSFGALHLADLAKELEMLGKENKLNEVGNKIKALEETYQAAAKELKGMAS